MFDFDILICLLKMIFEKDDWLLKILNFLLINNNLINDCKFKINIFDENAEESNPP